MSSLGTHICITSFYVYLHIAILGTHKFANEDYASLLIGLQIGMWKLREILPLDLAHVLACGVGGTGVV